MPSATEVVLLPDAGPLITLAYADALDVLFKPGWRVALVDMVLHEVTRHQTPTSDKLAKWVNRHQLTVLATQTCAQYRQEMTQPGVSPQRKANLGELAVQETINQFVLQQPPQTAVFLFEDHRIAKASFFLPEPCQKISTRAFLMFLEQKGWIASASAIERQAIQAGRAFSQLRFPPD
jgi:hypothetical protein